MLESIPASFVPTLLSQIQQVTDNQKRITTDPGLLGRSLNKAIAKLPFIAATLPKAYKSLGQNVPRETYQDGTNTLFNVFLNPGFVSTYRVDPLVTALLKPYEQAGETKQFPKSPSPTGKLQLSEAMLNRIIAHGKDHFAGPMRIDLTGKEMSALQRIMAAQTTKALRDVDWQEVRGMDPEHQANELAKAVNSASTATREWYVRTMLQRNHGEDIRAALKAGRSARPRSMLQSLAKAKAA